MIGGISFEMFAFAIHFFHLILFSILDGVESLDSDRQIKRVRCSL